MAAPSRKTSRWDEALRSTGASERPRWNAPKRSSSIGIPGVGVSGAGAFGRSMRGVAPSWSRALNSPNGERNQSLGQGTYGGLDARRGRSRESLGASALLGMGTVHGANSPDGSASRDGGTARVRDMRNVPDNRNGFAKEIRKRFRTAKADRQYERSVGARDRAEEQRHGAVSRAAVYQMNMGSVHRKSARMQDEQQRGSFSLPFSLPGLSSLTAMPNWGRHLAAVAVVLVFTVGMLYPSFQNCYLETRQLQQLEAEYAALESYDQQMQSKVDYLSTDEGIEDYARSELGMVRAGEHVVSVEGVQSSAATAKTDRLYAISSGSVKAPDTWYSGVLDVLFGYGS